MELKDIQAKLIAKNEEEKPKKPRKPTYKSLFKVPNKKKSK